MVRSNTATLSSWLLSVRASLGAQLSFAGMNLLAKTFYSAAFLLAASASAEFIRQDGHWQVKAGTTPEITPAERMTVVLIAMDIASAENDSGEQRAALKSWALVAEANRGNPAEALAMLDKIVDIYLGKA